MLELLLDVAHKLFAVPHAPVVLVGVGVRHVPLALLFAHDLNGRADSAAGCGRLTLPQPDRTFPRPGRQFTDDRPEGPPDSEPTEEESHGTDCTGFSQRGGSRPLAFGRALHGIMPRPTVQRGRP